MIIMYTALRIPSRNTTPSPRSLRKLHVPTRFHVEKNMDSLGIYLSLPVSRYYPDKVYHLDAQEEIFS